MAVPGLVIVTGPTSNANTGGRSKTKKRMVGFIVFFMTFISSILKRCYNLQRLFLGEQIQCHAQCVFIIIYFIVFNLIMHIDLKD